MKRLRTIAGIVMRDMQRSFTPEQIAFYAEQFSLYTKVLLQKRSDKDKIYSLHEPHIYAMAKGKIIKAMNLVLRLLLSPPTRMGLW